MDGTAASSILDNPAPATTRTSDPDTSFVAARSVKSEATRAIYKQVILILGEHGPSTDEGIAQFLAADMQSPSGMRTRRKELVDGGYIEWTGYKKKLESGLYGRCWQLTAKGGSVYTHWTGNQVLKG